MKVFNSKIAAEEYMSNHTLTFSTPELTLLRYSFWLGDIVPDPKDKEKTIPRLMTYLEEKSENTVVNIIDDDKYVPSGAVKKIGTNMNNDIKYCPECGKDNSIQARFCIECGKNQEE
ncbi:MAG: zinc ribbon domain-containing protein [Thaumarchaeota archaeon]|nr:zinc ribbon domain-containing protein [Nitrososphaerota archaeon]MCY3976433.1 zinc ribbon domain-containing protein [Nitrososphaerota archaeon]